MASAFTSTAVVTRGWFAPSASANHLLVELPYRGEQGRLVRGTCVSVPVPQLVRTHISYIPCRRAYVYEYVCTINNVCAQSSCALSGGWGGVVSHQTFAISLSVSRSEGNFEVSSVTFPGGLDPTFLLSRFGER